jgi:putative transposase
VLVDTLGLIWSLVVLPASIQDFAAAPEVIRRTVGQLPRLVKVWADAMYRNFVGWVAAHCRWVLEIVTGKPGATRFEVQPMRWIVERTFGWFGRYRRLSKDYETNPKSSETWIYIAMIHRMSRFVLPQRNRDDHLLRRPRLRLKT